MTKTVIALFDDVGRAQRAYEALKVGGFAHERIEVQTGEEFVRRGRVPPAVPERGGFRGAIKSFFDEIGMTVPAQPAGDGDYRPIARTDRLVVLETSDDRADEAAAILDHEGAVDVEERITRTAAPRFPGGREVQARGARIYPSTQTRTGDYVPRAPTDD